MLFRNLKKIQINPDLTLQEVWDTFAKEPDEKSDQYHRAVFRKLQRFEPEARQGILNDLLQIEAESMRQNDRLRHVREKIMDLIDRRNVAGNLHRLTSQGQNQNGQIDEPSAARIELAISDCDIQITVLRTYSREKYGDHGRNDWFRMYSYLSEFFNKNMIPDSASGPEGHFIFEGESLEPTRENYQLCRDRCLEAYVHQQFDIPTDNSNRLLKFMRSIRRKPFWRKLVN